MYFIWFSMNSLKSSNWMEKPSTKMTNYFIMRILLFKTHKHKQKKKKKKVHSSFCGILCSKQSSDFPSSYVSHQCRTQTRLFQHSHAQYSKWFLLTMFFFFPLQLPQGTVKILSSNNERNTHSVTLLREHPSRKPCLKSGDFPSTVGSSARFGC